MQKWEQCTFPNGVWEIANTNYYTVAHAIIRKKDS